MNLNVHPHPSYPCPWVYQEGRRKEGPPNKTLGQVSSVADSSRAADASLVVVALSLVLRTRCESRGFELTVTDGEGTGRQLSAASLAVGLDAFRRSWYLSSSTTEPSGQRNVLWYTDFLCFLLHYRQDLHKFTTEYTGPVDYIVLTGCVSRTSTGVVGSLHPLFLCVPVDRGERSGPVSGWHSTVRVLTPK